MDIGAADTLFGEVATLMHRGNDPDRAVATVVLRHTLLQGISRLRESDHTTAESTTQTNIVIGTGPNVLPAGWRIHSDLLPVWKELAEALCQFTARGHEHGSVINIVIQNVGLPIEVLNILEPALTTARLNVLCFSHTGLGRDGAKFLAHLLETNPSIQDLSLDGNEIEYGPETLSLLEAARKHAGLRVLDLDECGIGGMLSVLPEIIPPLLRLRSVHLAGNGIGSHGADLISSCLATNPSIKQLYLNDNMLNDGDATMFARSLITNRNLLQLTLHGNSFTDAGTRTLYKCIYDDQSLNSIHHSNHTCWLELFADGQPVPAGIHEEVLPLNGKLIDSGAIPKAALKRFAEAILRDEAAAAQILFPDGRKKIKILLALQSSGSGDFNTHYLKKVSMKLMPRVLVLLQESCEYAGTKEKSLETLFQVICSRPVGFCANPPEDTLLGEVHQNKMWCQWSLVARILFGFFKSWFGYLLHKARTVRSVTFEKKCI